MPAATGIAIGATVGGVLLVLIVVVIIVPRARRRAQRPVRVARQGDPRGLATDTPPPQSEWWDRPQQAGTEGKSGLAGIGAGGNVGDASVSELGSIEPDARTRKAREAGRGWLRSGTPSSGTGSGTGTNSEERARAYGHQRLASSTPLLPLSPAVGDSERSSSTLSGLGMPASSRMGPAPPYAYAYQPPEPSRMQHSTSGTDVELTATPPRRTASSEPAPAPAPTARAAGFGFGGLGFGRASGTGVGLRSPPTLREPASTMSFTSSLSTATSASEPPPPVPALSVSSLAPPGARSRSNLSSGSRSGSASGSVSTLAAPPSLQLTIPSEVSLPRGAATLAPPPRPGFENTPPSASFLHGFGNTPPSASFLGNTPPSASFLSLGGSPMSSAPSPSPGGLTPGGDAVPSLSPGQIRSFTNMFPQVPTSSPQGDGAGAKAASAPTPSTLGAAEPTFDTNEVAQSNPAAAPGAAAAQPPPLRTRSRVPLQQPPSSRMSPVPEDARVSGSTSTPTTSGPQRASWYARPLAPLTSAFRMSVRSASTASDPAGGAGARTSSTDSDSATTGTSSLGTTSTGTGTGTGVTGSRFGGNTPGSGVYGTSGTTADNTGTGSGSTSSLGAFGSAASGSASNPNGSSIAGRTFGVRSQDGDEDSQVAENQREQERVKALRGASSYGSAGSWGTTSVGSGSFVTAPSEPPTPPQPAATSTSSRATRGARAPGSSPQRADSGRATQPVSAPLALGSASTRTYVIPPPASGTGRSRPPRSSSLAQSPIQAEPPSQSSPPRSRSPPPGRSLPTPASTPLTASPQPSPPAPTAVALPAPARHGEVARSNLVKPRAQLRPGPQAGMQMRTRTGDVGVERMPSAQGMVEWARVEPEPTE